jgi:hypothetical protein
VMISSTGGNLKQDQDLDKAVKSPFSSSSVVSQLVHLLHYVYIFCK